MKHNGRFERVLGPESGVLPPKMNIAVDPNQIMAQVQRRIVRVMLQAIIPDKDQRANILAGIGYESITEVNALFDKLGLSPKFGNARIDGSLEKARTATIATVTAAVNEFAGCDVFAKDEGDDIVSS